MRFRLGFLGKGEKRIHTISASAAGRIENLTTMLQDKDKTRFNLLRLLLRPCLPLKEMLGVCASSWLKEYGGSM